MGRTFRGDERKKLKDKYKLERERRQKRQIEESKPDHKEQRKDRYDRE